MGRRFAPSIQIHQNGAPAAPRTVGRGAGKEAGGVFAAGRNGAERTLRRRGDVAQYPGMKAFFNLK